MNAKEALRILWEEARTHQLIPLYNNALLYGCVALRKQIATETDLIGELKKPLKIGNTTFKEGTHIVAKCPRCHTFVNTAKQFYCDQCGQKLKDKPKRY